MVNLGNVNRQYIGARYVPKFFNNNGSADWVQGIPYEPLTIVTYLHNSYTSTKYVPNTVGSPNIETDYWVLTGDYNYKLNELNNELIEVNNKLATKMEYYSTLAEAKTTYNLGDLFMVGGVNREDDYGYAIFAIGEDTYNITINEKQYHLVHNGKVNVAYVNLTDIGEAINTILNNNNIPLINKGSYKCSTTILTKPYVLLDFNNSSITTTTNFINATTTNVTIQNLVLNGSSELYAVRCFHNSVSFKNIYLSNFGQGFTGQHAVLERVYFQQVTTPIGVGVNCIANDCNFSNFTSCNGNVYNNCNFSNFTSCNGSVYNNCNFDSAENDYIFTINVNTNVEFTNCNFTNLTCTALLNLQNMSNRLTLVNCKFDSKTNILSNYAQISNINNDKLGIGCSSAEVGLFTGSIFISNSTKLVDFDGFRLNGTTIANSSITNGSLNIQDTSFTVNLPSNSNGIILKLNNTGSGEIAVDDYRIGNGTTLIINRESLNFTVSQTVNLTTFEILSY